MKKSIKITLLIIVYIISIVGAFLIGKFVDFSFIKNNNTETYFEEYNVRETEKNILTDEIINKIDMDMSLNEVLNIPDLQLTKGEEYAENDNYYIPYFYNNDDKNLSIVFDENNKIAIFSYSNNNNNNNEYNKIFDKEIYLNLKENMTYEEVRNLLGISGTIRSKNYSKNYLRCIYYFNNISITFVNNKLKDKNMSNYTEDISPLVMTN